METYIWLAIAIISVIVEVTTSGLAAIWFAPAALLSMVLAIFKVPISVQIPVFVIVSAVLMLLFYKKVKDNIDKKSEVCYNHFTVKTEFSGKECDASCVKIIEQQKQGG